MFIEIKKFIRSLPLARLRVAKGAQAARALVLCMLIAVLPTCVMGEDRTFVRPAVEAAREVKALLVERGICKSASPKDCGGVYGLAYMKDGFLFALHGVQDSEALADIQQILIRKLNETPDMQRVIFEAYAADGIPPTPALRMQGKIIDEVFRKQN